MAIAVLLWRLMGFPLSWRKGSRGTQISWIGGHVALKAGHAGVSVRIAQETFEDARQMVETILGANVVAKRALNSAMGKLAHIANLILVWRPFMASLYTALHADSPPGCPPGCVWVKQISKSLRWFRTFFFLSGGFVERDFDVRCFLRVGVDLEIIIDASPWGLGGILMVSGTCKEHFSSALTVLDEALFSQVRGSADGQHIWECLAALEALPLWRHVWGQRSLILRIRGGSMTMLSLIVNLRPGAEQLGLIGMEIAMECAQAVFVPVLAKHIPGVADVAADVLSRCPQPGYQHVEHIMLKNSFGQEVPARDKSYYITLTEPDVPEKRG
ncbi:unnamed protein product [Prorocentrum cordatum]|uniref:Uncharacterized protein n=1 Tax=Prorocentrum cordatum TaxID=2364126 RepID=A0ABN9XGX0_9DINO|nr:unnamed protein product [Polarella glacialis]